MLLVPAGLKEVSDAVGAPLGGERHHQKIVAVVVLTPDLPGAVGLGVSGVQGQPPALEVVANVLRVVDVRKDREALFVYLETQLKTAVETLGPWRGAKAPNERFCVGVGVEDGFHGVSWATEGTVGAPCSLTASTAWAVFNARVCILFMGYEGLEPRQTKNLQDQTVTTTQQRLYRV